MHTQPVARRRRSSSIHANFHEALEPRQLLSASFSNADLNGTWGLVTMGGQGTVQFDGTSNFSSAMVNSQGVTESLSGTYTVSRSGGLNLTNAIQGAINQSKNVAAASSTDHNSLAVLVNPGPATFSSADLNGNWSFFYNGDEPTDSAVGANNTGSGLLSFDGSSSFSGNITSDTGKAEAVSGTYTVGSDGTMGLDVAGEMNFHGFLNSSKDLLALNPTDMASATQNNETRLMVGVHRNGKYSNADLAGTWNIYFDSGTAQITFDGKGHISGGVEKSGKGTGAATGSYTVSADGTFTATVTSLGKTKKFTGAIDASRDAGAMVRSGVGAGEDDMSVLVRSVRLNHAPVLVPGPTLKGATGGTPFTLTYSALKSAAKVTDADGDPISYQITGVGSGTLLLDGSPAHAGDLIGADDTLTWTPPASGNGALGVLTVKATDGTDLSKTSTVVHVITTPEPAVSVQATKPKASEVKAATTGKGQFTFRRTGSLTSALTVNYSVSGTAVGGTDYQPLSGQITFAKGKATATLDVIALADAQPEGSETVIVALAAGGTPYLFAGKFSNATVTILGGGTL